MLVTQELCAALGFAGERSLMHARDERLLPRLHASEPLTRAEWLAALAATEIAFASDVFRGTGDFSPCTGFSDVAALQPLRGLQKKIAPHVWPILGRGVGTTRYPWARERMNVFQDDGAYCWIDGASIEWIAELQALAKGHRVAVLSVDASSKVLHVTERVTDLEELHRRVAWNPSSPSRSPRHEVWVFDGAQPVPSFDAWEPLLSEPEVVTLAPPELEFPDPPPTWPLTRIEEQRRWLRGCQSRLREALSRWHPLTFLMDDLVVTRDPLVRASIEERLRSRAR